MKKLVLGMVVATGLVVVMAGQSLAADLTSCDMNQAILEAEAVMREVGGEYSTLNDAKGVSIREHVKYLREQTSSPTFRNISKRPVSKSCRLNSSAYPTTTRRSLPSSARQSRNFSKNLKTTKTCRTCSTT